MDVAFDGRTFYSPISSLTNTLEQLAERTFSPIKKAFIQATMSVSQFTSGGGGVI